MASVDHIQQIIEHMANGVDAADVKALADSLKSLESGHAGEQQAVSVIKMMQALTKYLDTRKDKAHPGTQPVLDTLAQNFKRLLISKSAESRAQILSESKHTFKSLKSAIESGKLILDSEMEELKAVILSVDWEISSITMKGFDRVLSRLEKRLKSWKMHYTFLRIMHQIGAHIARRKADAHQDSIPLLRWVFQQYEMLVAHPDMGVDKKKQMVQENIQAYKSFKRKIDAESSAVPSPKSHTALTALETEPPVTEQETVRDNSEDDGFAPALSHINKDVAEPEDCRFFALDDPMTDPAPARAAKQSMATQNHSTLPEQDVMADLFSMKESAADELLDAIHLANMHGPDQENAATMPGVMDEAQKKAGAQQVTTQRLDNTPIPEIESRLDAFFNLAPTVSGVTDAHKDSPDAQALDHVESFSTGNELLDESVDLSQHIAPVPGIQTDDIHLEGLPGNDDEALPGIFRQDDTQGDRPGRESALDIDGLRSLLSDPCSLKSPEVFEQVQEQVAGLNENLDPDSDKAGLLDLVASMTRFIHHQFLPGNSDQVLPADTGEDGFGGSLAPDKGSSGGMETAVPDEAEEKDGEQEKKGFFAGLKSLFTGSGK